MPARLVRPGGEAEALARVVAALGKSGFLPEFARACEAPFAADQVTSFGIEPHRVRCLLAHRPRAQRLVEGLCRDYAAARMRSCIRAAAWNCSARVRHAMHAAAIHHDLGPGDVARG